jgi:hypothetical protein
MLLGLVTVSSSLFSHRYLYWLNQMELEWSWNRDYRKVLESLPKPFPPEFELLQVKKSSVFRDMTPFSSVNVSRRFGGTYLLHVHGRRARQASKKQYDLQNSACCLPASFWFLTRVTLRLWKCKRHVSISVEYLKKTTKHLRIGIRTVYLPNISQAVPFQLTCSVVYISEETSVWLHISKIESCNLRFVVLKAVRS